MTLVQDLEAELQNTTKGNTHIDHRGLLLQLQLVVAKAGKTLETPSGRRIHDVNPKECLTREESRYFHLIEKHIMNGIARIQILKVALAEIEPVLERTKDLLRIAEENAETWNKTLECLDEENEKLKLPRPYPYSTEMFDVRLESVLKHHRNDRNKQMLNIQLYAQDLKRMNGNVEIGLTVVGEQLSHMIEDNAPTKDEINARKRG